MAESTEQLPTRTDASPLPRRNPGATLRENPLPMGNDPHIPTAAYGPEAGSATRAQLDQQLRAEGIEPLDRTGQPAAWGAF